MVSVIVDDYILCWPYWGMAIFLVNMMKTSGDFFQTIENVRNQWWRTCVSSMAYYTFFDTLLYALFPRTIRAIAVHLFSFGYMMVYSYIVHNY